MKKAKYLKNVTITGILVVTLILGLSGLSKAQKTIDIDFMGGAADEPFIMKMAEQYEKTHPNMRVSYIVAPQTANRYHDKLVTLLAAHDTDIDIMTTDVVWPPELVAGGWLAPLDQYFPPEEQAAWVPATVEARIIGGHIYAIPYFHDIGLFYYRKDILDKSGIEVPKTWMEMVEICQRLQDPPNLYGFITCFDRSGQLECKFAEFLWSNGGEYTDDPATEALFNTSEGVEALQFMYDLIHKYKIVQPGVTSMHLDEGRVIFTQGKAIFHRNWCYVANLAEQADSKVQGKVGITYIPKFPGGRHASCLGGWAYSVNVFSPYVEEAANFSRYLGSREVQKERALTHRATPAISDLFADPDLVAKYQDYPAIMKVNDTVMWRPKTPFYLQISDIMIGYLQQALIGETSIKDALEDAAEEVNFLLGG